ncbi:low temperature requirement protein A, partial [Nonomuraea sp. NPDC049784]|uniref:low temperature requirement protein A n=1 Tax=Nonomuraea sp. NPDC049784 TaxID=3154361 RepID=UPI0033E14827
PVCAHRRARPPDASPGKVSPPCGSQPGSPSGPPSPARPAHLHPGGVLRPFSVFTVTQQTALLVVGLDALQPGHWTVRIGESALQVMLVFGVMWWVYSDYVWLLSSVPPTRPARRILVLLGMTGFLLMALAIPTTFSGNRRPGRHNPDLGIMQ